MTALADIKTRVLQVLDDANGTRYADEVLEESIRLTLDALSRRLPRLLSLTLTVTTPGRDQAITGMDDCLFIVSVSLVNSAQLTRELAPDSEFTYLIQDAAPTLHFSGTRYPAAGDVIQIQYAAPYTLANSFSSEIGSGVLPAIYESALVNGAAGQACILRATHLIGSYGARSDDAPRLLELGRIRLDDFESLIGSLSVQQDFGYPPGFALDKYDSNGSGRYK